MYENTRLTTTGVFEGVAENRRSVERPIGVDPMGHANHRTGEPRWVNVDRMERVAEDLAEQPTLAGLLEVAGSRFSYPSPTRWNGSAASGSKYCTQGHHPNAAITPSAASRASGTTQHPASPCNGRGSLSSSRSAASQPERLPLIARPRGRPRWPAQHPPADRRPSAPQSGLGAGCGPHPTMAMPAGHKRRRTTATFGHLPGRRFVEAFAAGRCRRTISLLRS